MDQYIGAKSLTRSAIDLATSISGGPLSGAGMVLARCPTTVTEALLISPSTLHTVCARMPHRVSTRRPLEIKLAAAGDLRAASSVARCISSHVGIKLVIDPPGQSGGSVSGSVHVSARPLGGYWVARVLMHPAAWADADTVTLVSMTLAGRPMPCAGLPATLRVGYNHAPAAAGAVLAATMAADVRALKAALNAGASTEEADEVSSLGWGLSESRLRSAIPRSRRPVSLTATYRKVSLQQGGPPVTATWTSYACSWRLGPTRPRRIR